MNTLLSDYEIILNKILIGDLNDVFTKPNVRCISGFNSPAIMIEGLDGIYALNRICKKIFDVKNINRGHTYEEVRRLVESDLLDNINNSNSTTQEKFINNIKNRLKTNKLEKFYIQKNIYGINFKNHKKIGPFSFYKGRNTKRRFGVNNQILLLNNHLNLISENVVSIEVDSSSNNRAVEIADEYFIALEYLFAFLHGRNNKQYEVRIIRQTANNLLNYITKSESGNISMGVGHTNLTMQDLDIDDDFFKTKNIKKLFEIIGCEPSNKIERRIRNAIIWIGKGQFADSSIEAIINNCSGLESLLIRDAATVLSPSIMASLSELCAFLLASEINKRKEIVKLVKRIYSERSAGTHGGKVIADKQIESDAFQIGRALVFKILELYQKGNTSDADVLNYIDNLKFG